MIYSIRNNLLIIFQNPIRYSHWLTIRQRRHVGRPLHTVRYRIKRIGRRTARPCAGAGGVRIVAEHVPDVGLARRVPLARSTAHGAVQRFDALLDRFGVIARQNGNAGVQFGAGQFATLQEIGGKR